MMAERFPNTLESRPLRVSLRVNVIKADRVTGDSRSLIFCLLIKNIGLF